MRSSLKQLRLGKLGLALTVVFMMGAIASGSALATLPEFVPHTGTFTGSSGAFSITEQSGATYVCKSSSVTGELSGPKEVAKVVLKMNCGGGLSVFCKSTWETTALKGRIAYTSASTVGLLLEAPTGIVAECIPFGGSNIIGSVIGAVAPLNSQRTGYILEYGASSKGIQRLQHFTGEELLHNLEITQSTAKEKFALEATMTLTFNKSIEIRA